MRTMKTIKVVLCCLFIAFGGLCRAQVYPPTPLAGKALTQDFIERNQHYPEKELDDKVNGTVTVSFFVDGKGVGKDYRISKSFCPEADKDALDLVKKIQWSPGTKDMKPIGCDMEYSVEYNARTYHRYWKKHQRAALPLALEADTSYRVYDIYALEDVAKPFFADGSNMAQYIVGNLEYPQAAKAGEISGTVRLSFIVETDGSISNILVKQSVGGGCDNEAIRLLQETHWIPAVKNGKYVRSHNTQDITFSIGSRNYIDGSSY